MGNVNGDAITTFHGRLRKERERLGLTQWAFATACGLATRTYARYERGERVPDVTVLLAAARAGADVAYLISGSQQPLQQLDAAEKFADSALNFLISQCLGDLDRDGLFVDLKELVEGGAVDEERPARAVAALIRRSASLTQAVRDAVCGEGTLLDGIGDELANAAEAAGTPLSTRQIVEAIKLLYRVTAPVGNVDRGAVLQVVRLVQK